MISFGSTLNKERWKYTSLRGLDGFPFSDVQPLKTSHVTVPVLPFETAGRLVFVDGFYVPGQSDFPETISIKMIEAEFPQDNPFMKHLKPSLSEGVEITVEALAEVAKPIDCVFLFTDKSKDCASHLHHRIHLKQGAKASFIMRYVGLTSESYVTNTHTLIHTEPDAQVTLYHFQLQGKKAFHVEAITTHQARNSAVTLHSLSLGALLARIDFTANYHDVHAASTVYGVYHVNGRQHVDYHLDAEHLVSYGKTAQHVKGCVDDEARAVFNGRVCVKPGAIKAISDQSHHGLLLSKYARIDAKPELEIDCDDVQCRHGATVGALRADALFYLMARGIDEAKAKAMLELAHAASLLDAIDSPDIKTYMHDLLMLVVLKTEALHA